MEAIISFGDGRRVEVLVATVGRFTMRVIARGRGDAMELRSDYGQWVDEAGRRVEFEAFVAGAEGMWSVPAAHATEIQSLA